MILNGVDFEEPGGIVFYLASTHASCVMKGKRHHGALVIETLLNDFVWLLQFNTCSYMSCI